MLSWLFSACSADPNETADLVLTEEHEVQQQPTEEDVPAIRQRRSKNELSQLSAPSDERNFIKWNANEPPDHTEKKISPVTSSSNQPSGGSDSDDPTPEPVEPLAGAFSNLWPSYCVMNECADANGDGEDSFFAVFNDPHFVAADRGGYEEWPDGRLADAPTQPPRPTMKGMTIRVHAPRQRLPETDYEIQWRVDPPQFSGLVRVQATVVRDRFKVQYACSETGRPIEVHQEGERIEVARVTCYRLRPRILQQQYDTTWRESYPSVERFFQAVPEGPVVDSYYQPRGVVQPVSQLLLEDLYVHHDYRGGGLGLSLLDHASRKVGDVLSSVVLGLPPGRPIPRNEQDESTLEHYFGLLGFRSIHPHYMARTAGHVFLEEACPTAPILDPARREAY